MISFRHALLIAVAAFLLAPRASAQTAVPLVTGGDPANRVDVLVLGDGYTAGQLAKFATDTDTVVSAMLAASPFLQYRSYVNVWRVDWASNESGASHPNTGLTRDTAFGAYYNCSGVERLICLDSAKVAKVLAAIPATQRDFVVVLVNDPEYGGSGGTYAVTSTVGQFGATLLHEHGHTLGLLSDEYGGPPPPACVDTVEPTSVNATKVTTRSELKWLTWIDTSTPIPTTSTENGVVGLFQGAKYCDSTLYRPTYNSRMRTSAQAFHAVNEEQLIRRIYAYVDPIDSVSPPTSLAVIVNAGQSQTFTVATLAPVGRAMNIGWWLDGTLVGSSSSYSVSAETIGGGLHELQVIVTDPTPAVRTDPQGVLTGTATWQVAGPGMSPDFSFRADSAALAVTRGRPGSVTLNLEPGSGRFVSAVTFSCAGLPDKAQCGFTPGVLQVGSATTSVTMTITTTASGSAVRMVPPRGPGAVPGAMALVGFVTLVSLVSASTCSRHRRARVVAALAVCAALTALAVGACGGGASTSPPTTPAYSGTPVGTYGISVNAVSGNVTHTVVVSLTVQ
jgi:hypothetical protein